VLCCWWVCVAHLFSFLSLFVFRGVRAAQSSVFCIVFCLSLFVFRGVCAAQSSVFCVVFCLSLFVFVGFVVVNF
jgi:hypothetical protein